MFSKETYVTRRARLMKEVGDGVLLFLGNQLVGMNYHDNEYPFRQDSWFLYFWGLDHAGLSAVIDIDRGEEVIFGRRAHHRRYCLDRDHADTGAQRTVVRRGENHAPERAQGLSGGPEGPVPAAVPR